MVIFMPRCKMAIGNLGLGLAESHSLKSQCGACGMSSVIAQYSAIRFSNSGIQLSIR